MQKVNYKEASKINWEGTYIGSFPGVPRVNMASMQRTADAIEKIAENTELMAKNYIQLQQDAEMFRRWYKQEQEKRYALERKVASLKGVITRMKRRAGDVK